MKTATPLYQVAGLSALCLSLVWMAQYGLGVVPCFLCHLQRAPWIAILLMAMLSLKRPSPHWKFLALLCCGVGMVLSGYHVGVEQEWWAPPALCHAGRASASLEDVLRHIETPAGPSCADRPWTFLWPWPVWNIMASLLGIWILLRGNDR